MDGERSVVVDATVDTGASYTTLPGSMLRDLGIEPIGKRVFLLGDGTQPELEIGEARAAIGEESVATIVAFGEENSPMILGAYTLEGLALAVDPLAERLVPRQLIMY